MPRRTNLPQARAWAPNMDGKALDGSTGQHFQSPATALFEMLELLPESFSDVDETKVLKGLTLSFLNGMGTHDFLGHWTERLIKMTGSRQQNGQRMGKRVVSSWRHNE